MKHTVQVPAVVRRVLCGLVLSVASSVAGLPLLASTPDCEALAARAAAERGLPEGLLPSIARVESGRGQGRLGRRAWPWTLNQGGKGMYFDTRAEALDYLRAAVARGVRNIDVGCMQINYRWHGAQFESLEAMMDPDANTRYAARFLGELQARHGSWEAATGYYHSLTPARARHYRGLVARVLGTMPSPSEMLARLEAAEPLPAPPPPGAASAPVPALAGLVAHGTGPLVALVALVGPGAPDPGPQDVASPYLLAMSGGGVLPDAALPNLAAARADRKAGPVTRAMARDRVRSQIASLRADFDRQSRQDGR